MNKTKPYIKIDPIWEFEYSFKYNQKTKYWTLTTKGKQKGKDLTSFKQTYLKDIIELRKYLIQILSIENVNDLFNKTKNEKEN